MDSRETTFDERRRLALGLPPDADVDEAMETAPLDEGADGTPIAGNEDPQVSDEGARSEDAGMDEGARSEDAGMDDEPAAEEAEQPKRRGRKPKEDE